MKILNFKILRQTILLLLLLSVSSFEVSVAEERDCPLSSKVKSVELRDKRTSKLLLVTGTQDDAQVMLSRDNNSSSELYMFTLPASVRFNRNKKAGGQFLLYDPGKKLFICSNPARHRRKFVTERFPNLKRCTFTEYPEDNGYVKYKAGKDHFLLNNRTSYTRRTKSCSCPKVTFHKNMLALKEKLRSQRHNRLTKILRDFKVTDTDIELCKKMKGRN